MKKTPKNIPSPYKSKGTPIFRDTTDSNLFNDGGKAGKSKYYTYKDHRDQYMKKGNQWYISNEFTDFNFQPIKDPKGTRAKELNKNAKEFPIDEGKTFEAKVNKALGNPMDQAYRAAEYFAPPGEDPIDNFRHPIAGRYATEAISNYVNSGYPIIDKTVGFIGANAMGVGHELNTLLKDKRPWSTKLPEAGEDIYNNFIGTTIGVSSMTPRQKTNYLLNLSDNNQLPDGYGHRDDKKNMYWKDQQGRGSYNSKLKNGGELLAQPYPNSFFASDLKSYYADGGPLHDRDNESGRLLNSTYASALGRMFRDGGYFDHGYSLPEDSFKQGGRGLKDSIYASTSGQYPANYKQGGNINVVAGGEKHRVYIKKSPTGVGEGTQGHVMVNHPTMDKGQWDTIDLTEKSGAKTVAQGIAATKKWHRENPNVYKKGGSIMSMSNTPQLEGEGKDLTYPDGAYVYANGGQMIKRADGSYSQRGLWDNIRANKGSGKKPTKEMLAQEKKINANTMADGGPIYSYAGRPDAQYKKVNDKWFINAPGTNGFIPVNDPTGKRTALLNAQAVVKPRGINYDPFLDNAPITSESTVPKQYIDPQMQQVTAQKMVKEQMAQGTLDNITREKIQSNPILSEQQKQEILLDPRKIREYNYLAKESPDTIKATDTRGTGELIYDVVTNPFTAAEYAISGGGVENMPRNINEMRAAGIDPGVVQGRNLVGNTLNATTNLIDAGDKLVRNTAQGDYMGAIGEGLRFIPIGLGAYAGTKTALQQAERLGVGNVVKGKASVKDLFKRDDLININTPEDLANYQAAMLEGKLSPTRNRYYSSLDNPDALKYAKGQENVFVHRIPQTKAAAAGKSLANVKPEGAGLIARQRSVPTVSDVDELINSGKLSGYSDETLQGLKEVAANPEGYWNLDSFKTNPELQNLIKDPSLVNPAEHLLPRPNPENFVLMPVGAIGASKPALIEGKEILNEALKGIQNAGKPATAAKSGTLLEQEDNTTFKQGGTMNFKSKGAYQKWLAYGHASGEFAKTPGNQKVSIDNEPHKVQHAFGGSLYAGGGFMNKGFQSLPKDVQAKIKANSFADGGPMAQLTEFNAGGTHEENPVGGIPQGVAPNGQVNLVEQGETKLNSENYIFSDSLKVDKETAKNFGLPNSTVGKTFAEASKALNMPKSRRENDTIEESAIKRNLDNLMGAQEFYKQEQVDNTLAELQSLAPDLYEQMMQGMQSYQPMEMGEGMPGEMTEQEVMMDETGQPVSPDQIPPEMLAQMPEAQAGMPVMAYGGHMYKCGGKMYNFGGQMYNMGGSMYNYGGRMFEGGGGLTAEQKARMAQGSYLASNAPSVYQTANQEAADRQAEQEAREAQAGNVAGQIGKYGSLAAQAVNTGMLLSDENATAEQKSQGVYDTGVAVASAINPVVGGLIQVGDMAGGALKENVFEKYNDEGELQNENTAKAGAVLGSFFNPWKAITTRGSYEGGWTDFTGDKYVEYLEEQKKKELGITEDPTQTYSSQLGAVMNPGYMKQGGYLAARHRYEQSYPTYKDNAGPQGQPLTNLYADGGQMYNESLPSYSPDTFNMLSMGQKLGQQMYEPLDQVYAMGGNMYVDGGTMGDPPPTQQYYANPEDEYMAEFLAAEENKYSPANFPGTTVAPVSGTYNTMNAGYRDNSDFDTFLANEEAKYNVTPTAPAATTTNQTPVTAAEVLTSNNQDELVKLQNAILNAETEEELKAAQDAYRSALQRLDETLSKNDVDMTIQRKLGRDIAMAAPAAYNIATGLFEKANQLNPANYMVRADLQGTEMNIEPIRRRIQQNYAQALNAARNAGVSGGNYMTNVQQLAAAQNAAVHQAEVEKLNADITSAERAAMANKQIESGNIQTKQQIEQLNRQASEAKRRALTTGLTQVADIARNMYDLDAQKALAKAVSPTFGDKFGMSTYKALEEIMAQRATKEAEKNKKKEEEKK